MSFQLRREEVLNGDQLSAMLSENPAKAAQAILMAAKEGIVDGQALLGQILLDGQGIERDPVLARRWFQIAANAGKISSDKMSKMPKTNQCHGSIINSIRLLFFGWDVTFQPI